MTYRVAVIGTGIAGLSAAWRLGLNHHITLYERAPSLGMAAHGWQTESGTAVDVPIRVMSPAYYPALLGILAEAGVKTRFLDGSASFTDFDGSTYFRYSNETYGPLAMPKPWLRAWISRESLRIISDFMRLSRAARDLVHGDGTEDLDGLTLGELLARDAYNPVFVHKLLLPIFATLCTCTYEQAEDFPARTVLEYLGKGMVHRKLKKAVGGASAVVKALASRADEVLCGVEVQGIERTDSGVVVIDGHQRRTYDHVVVATQSNSALKVVSDLTHAERTALAGFSYTPIEVVMHRDRRVMPEAKKYWSPVNYVVDPNWQRPMATLWINTVYPELKREEPIFQTVHPAIEPDPRALLARSSFERPVVNLDTQQALDRLSAVHDEPDRRLWFCGSYAMAGIPLLESAAGSAVRVAEGIERSRLPTSARSA